MRLEYIVAYDRQPITAGLISEDGSMKGTKPVTSPAVLAAAEALTAAICTELGVTRQPAPAPQA